MNYKELLDVVFIDHPSVLAFKQEYLKSIGDAFDVRSVRGKDGDLEYGRRLQASTSTKKYCMLTDADDIFFPGCINRLVMHLESDDTLAAAVGCDMVYADGKPLSLEGFQWDARRIDLDYLKATPLNMHNAVVWRTEVLQQFLSALPLGFGSTPNFDYEFKKEFIAQGHKAIKYPEIGVYYRYRKDKQNYLHKYVKGK